jgi:hypothetical protein
MFSHYSEQNSVGLIVRNKNLFIHFLLVNLGGTAGLLVGGSLLSLVEMLYYFLVRPVWEAVRSRRPHSHIHSEHHLDSCYNRSLQIRVPQLIRVQV